MPKPHAILYCPFEQVLLLDADNAPVVNPEYLFETSEFKETGAVFWPDISRSAKTRAIWHRGALRRPAGPEFETGQVLVDKRQCWRALSLCMWFNRRPRHNLQRWLPRRNRQATLAGVHNSGLVPLACSAKAHFVVVDAHAIASSPAFVLSQATLAYAVQPWHDLEGTQDRPMPRLARRLKQPAFYHTLSLVQHLGARRGRGVRFLQAADFDPEWRASGPFPTE